MLHRSTIKKTSSTSLRSKLVSSIFILIVVIACISLSIWRGNGGLLQGNDLDSLAGNANFTLPKSAQNGQTYFEGFNSFSMDGKFDMDADEFDEFEENSNCDAPFKPINPESSYLKDHRLRWWHPSATSLICYGGRDGCGKTIIVDTVQTETYTVYVSAQCG